MNQMRRNQFINLAAWLGLLLASALCVALIDFKQIMLGLDYKTAKGTITNKFPNNHLGISYNYQVDGHPYEGTGYAGQINRAFEGIHIGDTVSVFYNARWPDSSTLDSPSVLFVRSIGQLVALSFILSLLGMCVFHRYQLLPECDTFKKCRPKPTATTATNSP
jgi:hypothetical protein